VRGETLMPGCVLRASGDEFVPADFLRQSFFNPCNVFLINERRGSSSVWPTSGFTVDVSSTSGDEIEKQIEDALEFLNRYREELTRLVDMPGLTDLRLDFGVNRKNVFVQSSYFPPALLKVAASLNVGIEISIYGNDGYVD
jgi:hypothetical protein